MTCKTCGHNEQYQIGNAAYCELCGYYVEPDRAAMRAVLVICLIGIAAMVAIIFLEPLINP